VKGHDGKVGNEIVDARAKREVRMRKRMHMPDIVTPAGIRQAYPPHLLVTDEGPQRPWMLECGKTEDPTCMCDGWTPQNAAHLLRYPWIGDGRGRSWPVGAGA